MRKVVTLLLLLLVILCVTACTKSVGPNRKSDALKRAKEYVKEKYGEEFEKAKVVRCTSSGEKLTYSSYYMITDEAVDNSYVVVVDYDAEGNYVEIGDNKQSEQIIADFEKWATISNVKPSNWVFGGMVPGGGENTITENIYYFNQYYSGDMDSYIRDFEGNIYITYDASNDVMNTRIGEKLRNMVNDCESKIQIIASQSKQYNMGLSKAVPAENISRYILQEGVLEITELRKKTVFLRDNLKASTYIDVTSRNMIEEAKRVYDTQDAFLADGNILKEQRNVYKDENGKKIGKSYLVEGNFEGSIEIAFSRNVYESDDIKVYAKEGELVSPSTNNDRFYYDDNNFYYLVSEGYIIAINK